MCPAVEPSLVRHARTSVTVVNTHTMDKVVDVDPADHAEPDADPDEDVGMPS